jgi:hypothetical protein
MQASWQSALITGNRPPCAPTCCIYPGPQQLLHSSKTASDLICRCLLLHGSSTLRLLPGLWPSASQPERPATWPPWAKPPSAVNQALHSRHPTAARCGSPSAMGVCWCLCACMQYPAGTSCSSTPTGLTSPCSAPTGCCSFHIRYTPWAPGPRGSSGLSPSYCCALSCTTRGRVCRGRVAPCNCATRVLPWCVRGAKERLHCCPACSVAPGAACMAAYPAIHTG